MAFLLLVAPNLLFPFVRRCRSFTPGSASHDNNIADGDSESEVALTQQGFSVYVAFGLASFSIDPDGESEEAG